MGGIYVDVTVRNPADLQRSWTSAFLVDTGAFDSLVPRAHLEADSNRKAAGSTPLRMGTRSAWRSRRPTWNSRERSWAAQSYMARKTPSRCLA